MLRGHRYGVLSTRSLDGGVSARLVQHLAVDATVWIGPSPMSRKATEIAASPEVAFSVEDRVRFAYTTVVGRADLVDGRTDPRRVAGRRGLTPAG